MGKPERKKPPERNSSRETLAKGTEVKLVGVTTIVWKKNQGFHDKGALEVTSTKLLLLVEELLVPPTALTKSKTKKPNI
jgi:hypothetical protein